MKKYKLLKDLPGLKSGVIITRHSTGDVNIEGCVVLPGTINYIDYLLNRSKDNEWFEPVEEKKVGEFWKPEEWKDYFYLTTDWKPIDVTYLKKDKTRIDNGNYFQTREEAQKFADYIKAVRKLQQVVSDLNENKQWDDRIRKTGGFKIYQIMYEYDLEGEDQLSVIDFFALKVFRTHWYTFKRKEDAEYSLKEHKDLWLTFHTGLK